MTSKKAKRRKRRRVPVPGKRPGRRNGPTAKMSQPAIEKGPDLTVQQTEFVRLYDLYLGNGTRAYRESHPDCTSDKAAAVGAWRTLRLAKVRDLVEASKAARWKRSTMQADEVLALVAQDARADIRRLYDDAGVLLPVHLWPDDIADSVVAVQGDRVVLASKSAARRIMLEQTGTIKGVGAGLDSLAKILAGDYEEAIK